MATSQCPARTAWRSPGSFSAFFCSILGLIFSLIGMNQTKQTGQSGRGLAIAGLVISIVSIGFSLIWFIAVANYASTS